MSPTRARFKIKTSLAELFQKWPQSFVFLE